jgi:hypothetical protein
MFYSYSYATDKLHLDRLLLFVPKVRRNHASVTSALQHILPGLSR